MAKIFWIAEKDGDYMEMFAFNNKRKAQEKAMELAPHFSFGDTEIPKEEDGDDGDQWLYSGMINTKGPFVLYRGSGMPHAYGDFVDEAEAARWVENEGYDTAGACFPAKLKGGMGSVYMSMEAEGNGSQLFLFTDGEVYEAQQTTMKYLPTFESFLNEYSTIVDTNKMLKALKKAVKSSDSFEEIGDELDDLDYKKDYKWEFVKDFKGTDVGGHPAYIITYLQGTRHAIADPDFWKNSSGIEDKVGDLAIGWILGR